MWPGSRPLPPASPDSQTQTTARPGPTHPAARMLAFACQGSKLPRKARRPTHTTLNGLPRPRRVAGAKPLPRRWKDRGFKGRGPKALASPVELPLIEQPMTGQEARRRRPSQAGPHDCSSTSQDSRRLGREPKITQRVWIPSLTIGRQPTHSTEAEYPHGPRPPRPSDKGSPATGRGAGSAGTR